MRIFALALAMTILLGASHGWATEKELLIGLIPEENIFKQVKRHRPLGQYISKRLGIKVRFTVLSRYPHIITRFVTRSMDGAIFGIFTGALAADNLGVEPLARSMGLDERTSAQGLLIARKDSGIKNLTMARGKRIAFVDQVTATGYLFVLADMRSMGLGQSIKYFSDYQFTGSHDSALYSVLSGKSDLAAVKDRIYTKMAEKDPLIKEELVIIDRSEMLPDNTFCVRADMPLELKLRLQETLLRMHEDPEGKEVLRMYEAKKFVEAVKKDFDPVRAMALRAGINLKSFRYED